LIYLASPSSRGASVNFTISSMDYANQVQVQADNLTWAKQVENREIQSLFLFYAPFVMNLFLRVGSKNNSCIRETQENSIEFLIQSSLPYIL